MPGMDVRVPKMRAETVDAVVGKWKARAVRERVHPVSGARQTVYATSDGGFLCASTLTVHGETETLVYNCDSNGDNPTNPVPYATSAFGHGDAIGEAGYEVVESQPEKTARFHQAQRDKAVRVALTALRDKVAARYWAAGDPRSDTAYGLDLADINAAIEALDQPKED